MSVQSHRYDFFDAVWIATTAQSGLIQSIHHSSMGHSWLYQVSTTGDHWWQEEELQEACPKCFSPLRQPTAYSCPVCGFRLVDAEMP